MPFCAKCGAEHAEGIDFCPQCGAAVNSAAPEKPVQEAPDTEEEFATADFSSAKRSHKKGWIALGVAGAVVAALAIVVALNFSAIKGAFIEWFGSDVQYFEYVEAKQFESYADTISDYYGAMMESDVQISQAANLKLHFNVGDGLTDLLAGTDYKDALAWLRDVELNYGINSREMLTALDLGLNISDVDIFTLSAIVDAEEGELFLSMPELTKQVFHQKFDMASGAVVGGMPPELGALLPELRSKLPSESEFNKLITRYINEALNSIDTVTKTSETITVNGVSQKCKVLEAPISQKTLCVMMEAMLTKAREDREIKDLVETFGEALGEKGLYETFLKELDQALAELAAEKAQVSDQALFVLTDYVNSKHQVIGRKVEAGGRELFSHITVENGGQFASRISAGDVALEGEGTLESGKKNGTYELTVEGKKYLELTVEDLETEGLEEGRLSGTLRLKPSRALFAGLDSTAAAMITMLDPVLELKFKIDDGILSLDVDLLSQGALFMGYGMEATAAESTEIVKPTQNLVELEDLSPDLLLTLDLEGLVQRLRQTDIPAEIVNALENAVRSLRIQAGGY